MTTKNWKIQLRWVKAHAGVIGNELPDKLAKEAAANKNIKETYKRVPKRVIIKELEDDSVKKWQTDWTKSTKRKITKDFFPDVKETEHEHKPHTKLHSNGHSPRKNKLIPTPFQINKNPHLPCGNSDQNIDHLIFECKLLNNERNTLKQSILKTNDWPTSKRDLIKRHIKEFMKFTNATPLDEINAEQNSCKPKC